MWQQYCSIVPRGDGDDDSDNRPGTWDHKEVQGNEGDGDDNDEDADNRPGTWDHKEVQDNSLVAPGGRRSSPAASPESQVSF